MYQSIDVRAFKRAHPIAHVISGYGIGLRPSGRALVGRCPFHADGGRPNLYVYPAPDAADDGFYCYRCPVGGDVIRFVQMLEHLDFRPAVERIGGAGASPFQGVQPPAGVHRPVRTSPHRRRPHDPLERACLAAAVELYANRLLTDPGPLAYLSSRGIPSSVIESCRLGYATGTGDELAAFLRWRRLPVQAALRAGLLGPDGHEWLAARLVVPVIQAGRPIWLVGRALSSRLARSEPEMPKYLGLPGRKPLLGWDTAALHPEVCLVEGPFDWLTLRAWDIPALALIGTYIRPQALSAFRKFERVFLLLDNDKAGRQASDTLQEALGDRAVRIALPGVKDVAELATAPDGRSILLEALDQWQLPVAA